MQLAITNLYYANHYANLSRSKGGNYIVIEVHVRDNNIEQALRALKKKLQREGVYREMKMRKHFEKPSERRVREQQEASRRFRKLQRKRDFFD